MTAHSGSFLRGLVSLAACLLLAGPATATHIKLDVNIDVGMAGETTSVSTQMLEDNSESVVENDDGSVSFWNGSMSTDSWTWHWDEIKLNENPLVHFAQSFTNTSGSAADFVFSTSVVTGSIDPSTLIGGSSSVSVADSGDGSATLQNTTGQPGYAGTLDGSTHLTLLDPFSLTVNVSGGTDSTSESNGLSGSGPTINAPAVTNSIGITHRFNLTTQDTATFNSTFNVEPIPEPATGLLLGLGCAGLAAVARGQKRSAAG